MSKIAQAKDAFGAGYNCAQSVAIAYSPEYGVPSATMARIATAFGGGVSRSDSICGAVSGALMILGLHLGTDNQPDSTAKAKTYTLGEEFVAEFNRRYGSAQCTDLVGYNLKNEDERKRASEANAFQTICSKVVENACGLLEEYLAKV
jgi:C_GCAxxG_C_C family probable redox protein